MMVRALTLLALTAMFAAPASAVPVLDVLTGSDGNFSFSVTHTASGGDDGQSGSVIDSIVLGANGGSADIVGGLLYIDVELEIGTGIYDVVGSFDLAGLLDDSAQLDVLLGSITLTQVGGVGDDYDGMTFYFEDRNYSNASLRPNSLEGDILSLWGATDYTGTPTIGSEFDLTTGGYGIDLRLQLANPVPEPGAALAFAAGILTVGLSARSNSRRR